MKKTIFIAAALFSIIANANMYEHAFPDLNNDGLRDKVELVENEDGDVQVNLYIAKAKYDYELVSKGTFPQNSNEVGPAGEVAHLSVNEKKEVVISQTVGSANRSEITHTFEFRKNDLYLTELSIVDTYFGNGSEKIYDYKNKVVTEQRIEKNRNKGSKKVVEKLDGKLLSLSEVPNIVETIE